MRGSSPHRQVTYGLHAALWPIAPAGEFHKATANGLLPTLLIFNENRRPEAMSGRVSHRGNVTPASPGRVDGPAACTARRGPDGVRGGRRFLRTCKNPRHPRTSHGRQPFPQASGRPKMFLLMIPLERHPQRQRMPTKRKQTGRKPVCPLCGA